MTDPEPLGRRNLERGGQTRMQTRTHICEVVFSWRLVPVVVYCGGSRESGEAESGM